MTQFAVILNYTKSYDDFKEEIETKFAENNGLMESSLLMYQQHNLPAMKYIDFTEDEIVLFVYHKMINLLEVNKELITNEPKKKKDLFKNIKDSVRNSCRKYFENLFKKLFPKDLDEDNEEVDIPKTKTKKQKINDSDSSSKEKSNASSVSNNKPNKNPVPTSNTNPNPPQNPNKKVSTSSNSKVQDDLFMYDDEEVQNDIKMIDGYFPFSPEVNSKLYTFLFESYQSSVYLTQSNFCEMCLNLNIFHSPNHISCIIGNRKLYHFMVTIINSSVQVMQTLKSITLLCPQGLDRTQFTVEILNQLNLKHNIWKFDEEFILTTEYSKSDVRHLVVFYSSAHYHKGKKTLIPINNTSKKITENEFQENFNQFKRLNLDLVNFLSNTLLNRVPGGSHQTKFNTIALLLTYLKASRDQDTWWEIGHGKPYMAIFISMYTKEVFANDLSEVSTYVDNILQHIKYDENKIIHISANPKD
jgi:hypothetical protein